MCVYKSRHVFYWSSFSHDLGIAELPHALWLFKILFTVWVILEVFHFRTLRKFYFMELLCITWSSSRSRFSWMTNNNTKTCKLLDKFFTCHFSQNTLSISHKIRMKKKKLEKKPTTYLINMYHLKNLTSYSKITNWLHVQNCLRAYKFKSPYFKEKRLSHRFKISMSISSVMDVSHCWNNLSEKPSGFFLLKNTVNNLMNKQIIKNAK